MLPTGISQLSSSLQDECPRALILPWNIADEVMSQNKDLAKNGSTFVIAVPELKLT
ncbi:hypothetical protein [Pseudophaeobacter sp. TrK17]|uniref:hypothetical protein n=1 Tax=Pseudophaeobacter sp. TrK17 TaxID=2815167 RepID=UPI0035D03F2F